MFNLIDRFYDQNELGLMVVNLMNMHYQPMYQPNRKFFGGDRMLGHPVHETGWFNDEGPMCPYDIFIRTFKKKTNIEPLFVKTFFRKTKLSECKESPSWKQYKPHQDSVNCDLAGLIYFNSNCLKDGTYFFNKEDDFEPTAIIGSKCNRCVFYSADRWHAPTMEQSVDERWTQPFFIIYKEETLKKFKEKNDA